MKSKQTIFRIAWIALMIHSVKLFSQISPCGTDELRSQLISSDPTFLARESQMDADIANLLNPQVLSLFKSSSTSDVTNNIKKIPVVIHLIGSTAIAQIDFSKINQQIAILNDRFRKKSGGNGVDTEIEFCLATKDQYGNPSLGVNSISGNYGPYKGNDVNDDINLKSIINWPAQKYLNIWVCNVDYTSGPNLPVAWATFPSQFLNTTSEFRDGIVISYNYFGITTDSHNNKGLILVHEVGHWLNLLHTWGNVPQGGCGGDDYIWDTPFCSGLKANTPDQTNNCLPAPIDECPGQNVPSQVRQIENYMDYSDDACRNMFTLGQKARMGITLTNFRAGLFNGFGTCPSCNDNILNGSETGIDCGGPECVPCTTGVNCTTIKFSINNQNTTTGQIINVCNNNIILQPFADGANCTGALWTYQIITRKESSHIPCDQVSGISPVAFECVTDTWPIFIGGPPRLDCYCKYAELFIAIQECDENKTLIGPEYGQWFDMDRNNPSINLITYMPTGASIAQGKYYKVKVATSNGGWKEHSAYFRVYQPSVNLNSQTVYQSQIGDEITLTNVTVPANLNVTYRAKNYIDVLPISNLKSGRYYVDNFNCSSLRAANENPVADVGTKENYSIEREDSKNMEEIKYVSNVKVQPNPNNGSFEIIGLKTGSYSINVFNLMGELVLQQNTDGNKQAVTLPETANGVYLVRVLDANNETVFKQKIIKQK
jgi:hypothetical protein